MTELATAYVSLAVSGKGLRRDVDKAMGAATGGVGSRAGRGIGSRMASGLGRALKVGAAAAATGAGIAAGAAAVSGFRSAVGQENIEKTLGGLYGSADKAESMMGRLRKVAGDSPIDFQAYGKAAESLAYAGVEGGQAAKVLENVGHAITATGGSSEHMDRATDAVTKMVNAGKVSLDSLQELSGSGTPIISGLAEHFGVSMDEINKMASEGSIGLEDVVSVMENATGDSFQKSLSASASASESFGNQWKIAKDNVVTALGDNLRPLMEQVTPLIGEAGGALSGFINNFGAGEGAAGRFRGALGDLGGALRSGFGAALERIAPVVSSVFTAMEPHVRTLGSSLRDLAPRAVDLAKAVGDFLVEAFRAARPYLEAVAKVVGVVLVGAMKALPPILSGVMSGLKWLLGVLKPLLPVIAAIGAALLTKYVVGMVAAGVQSAIAAAKTALFNVQMAIFIARSYAAAAAQKVAAVASKAWAIAQRLVNAAMRANPIGLLITGLLLLGAGLVLAYKKSETFRRIVNAAWAGIKGAASATVKWFRNTAWPWMKAVFTNIADAAKWLWQNGIKPAFNGIGKIISWWYKNVVKRYFTLVRAIFRGLAAAAKWLWNKGIKPAFRGIAALGSWLWKRLKSSFRLMTAGFRGIARIAKWLWKNAIRPYFRGIAKVASWLWGKLKSSFASMKRGFQGIARIAKWLWGKIRAHFGRIADNARWLWGKVKWAFDKMKAGMRSVKDGVVTARDGIKSAWSKIYGYLKNPIVKALRWLNKNFIGKLNKMLGKIPGVDLKIPKIPVGKGYARGGILPGYTPMSRGDDTLTPMRSGEGVLASEGLRDGRSRSMFLAANAAAKRGVGFADFMGGGYAKGGIVALGKKIQKMGYHVSEHPAFGGVVPGAHSANGYHYKGGALDINADSFNSKFRAEGPALDRLNRMLRSDGWNTIWRAANHFDHLHVDVRNGQKALSGAMSMINGMMVDDPDNWFEKQLKKITGKFSPKGMGLAGEVVPSVMKSVKNGIKGKVVDALSFGGGSWASAGKKIGAIKGIGNMGTKTAVRAVAAKYGWGSGKQWDAIDWIVNRESGWNPKAANPTSSARGLFQKMTSIHGPVESSVEGQARWGLNYFRKRYGSPLAAQSFWRRNHWYADGTDSARKGWGVAGENGPELINFSGGQQVYNRDQTMRLAKLASAPDVAGQSEGFSGPVVVNVIDRDGSFVERMRGEIDMAGRHSATRARMGAGGRF